MLCCKTDFIPMAYFGDCRTSVHSDSIGYFTAERSYRIKVETIHLLSNRRNNHAQLFYNKSETFKYFVINRTDTLKILIFCQEVNNKIYNLFYVLNSDFNT
jgi:hypothetical protein